jgi:hypothetical protein
MVVQGIEWRCQDCHPSRDKSIQEMYRFGEVEAGSAASSTSSAWSNDDTSRYRRYCYCRLRRRPAAMR